MIDELKDFIIENFKFDYTEYGGMYSDISLSKLYQLRGLVDGCISEKEQKQNE